ncbi:MFS transporter [Rhizobium leguminosarum]|uniref:MFS transporter n=2 Tax=Rhizobium leguminosarum TaxID=384 RepID=A0ACD5FD13_RHILE|nr:MFS transporter [Rhizobium leguminosarum]
MTSLPTAVPAIAAPAPTPFTFRLMLGLVGILIAALSAGLNDRVTSTAMPDIRGVLAVGSDDGSWFDTVFAVGEVMGMVVAPWLAVTFSMRKFSIAASLVLALAGAAAVVIKDPALFLLCRLVQGVAGGLLIPILMAAALRFLPPNIKLYGLAAYALTATFGPNIATPLTAFWTDFVGWQFVFLQVIPMCAAAVALILYGIPQDPLRLERLKAIDWRGVLLAWSIAACLIVGIEQGERFDWFRSAGITTLLVLPLLLVPLFVLNELHHPLPLIRPQLLLRRNFAFGVLMLSGFLVIGLAGSLVPSLYLSEVKGYRPRELASMAAFLAVPTLVFLPATSFLLSFRWLDGRYLIVVGLFILMACFYQASLITSDWNRDNFMMLQLAQAAGQCLIVVPLLMIATSVIAPLEGPFGSATINTVRAVIAPIASSLVEAFVTFREHFHSNVLLDRVGATRFLLTSPVETGDAASTIGAVSPQPSLSLSEIAESASQQAIVMSVADTFLMLTGVAIVLLFLVLFLPQRTYPPFLPKSPSFLPKR